MNEILNYLNGYKKTVDICYALPDGQKEKYRRKIDGSNSEAINRAIQELKDRGVKTIIVDVYKPNGTGKVFDRSFTIQNNERAVTKSYEQNSIGSLPLFDHPKIHNSMESWKDYALQTEREKVAKLEAKVSQLETDNKMLDEKVRDFEKEMIRKENDLHNFSKSLESKSGLNGLIEKASENPAVFNMLTGLAVRLLGLPPDGQSTLPQNAQGAPELINPKAEQYVANIKAWLYKQSDELQDSFYQLVYELTNSKDVASTCQKLINLFKNGTTIPNQSKAAS